jgi:DNA excision repair protein ERCC-5
MPVEEQLQKAHVENEKLVKQHKRNLRDAGDINSIMISETRELLEFFGIPFIVAPLEAESQCAFLQRNKFVDGIATDDSDVFLFGGDLVYRNLFNTNKYLETYSVSALESIGLSRPQLIQMAMLLGSDYTTGITHIGPVSSLEIVKSWPSDDLSGLRGFKQWVKDLQAGIINENDSPTVKKLVKFI